jgi:hypothetical protein
MERRVVWLCVVAGSTVGGLVPEAWGGSAFGLASIGFGVAGALAGLWLGIRVAA